MGLDSMADTNTVFDVHHHFGTNPLAGPVEDTSLEEKAARHIDVMELSDISGVALLAPPIYLNPEGLADTRAINDDLAVVRDQYPDYFPVAIGTVEPSYGSDALDEIDRILLDLELDGVMWHSRFQKAKPDAPIMYDFIERVGEHDGVVHLHAYVESTINAPWRVFKVIEDFPDVTFVVHDFFSGADQSEHLFYRAPSLTNAYFDTAAASFLTRRVEQFVEEIGAERLIFGTDQYTGFPIRRSWERDAIEYADLSEEHTRAVLSENFKTVYGL